MNDEHDESVVPPDESLAEAMPDPTAPPRPIAAEDPALRAMGVAGVVLVTVGGLLLPLSVATSSTQGATRSAKIKWEERQSEVRQALADEQAARSRPECQNKVRAIVMATKPQRRRVRWLLRQVEHALALVGLGMLIYFTCFDLSRIASNSMKPTLQGENVKTGDLVLSERVSYWFRRPRRWELIAFRRDDGVQVMKRVIGLPGEKVQMRHGGQIVIDGAEVAVPDKLRFLRYIPVDKVSNDKTVECGEGYFVLGDYSLDSDDSRYNGPLPPGDMVGRPWIILAPAGHRGFVNP